MNEVNKLTPNTMTMACHFAPVLTTRLSNVPSGSKTSSSGGTGKEEPASHEGHEDHKGNEGQEGDKPEQNGR